MLSFSVAFRMLNKRILRGVPSTGALAAAVNDKTRGEGPGRDELDSGLKRPMTAENTETPGGLVPSSNNSSPTLTLVLLS